MNDEYHCCVAGDRLETWRQRGISGGRSGGDCPLQRPSVVIAVATFHHAREYGDRDRAIIAAEQLFAEAFHLRQPQNHHHDQLIGSCVAYLHQHLGEEANFADLAEYLGVSYSYDKIKQVRLAFTGKIIFIDALHPQVQELLQDADLTILRMAQLCGFDDPYSFSRSFKRSVGVAPCHWRSEIVQWRGR